MLEANRKIFEAISAGREDEANALVPEACSEAVQKILPGLNGFASIDAPFFVGAMLYLCDVLRGLEPIGWDKSQENAAHDICALLKEANETMAVCVPDMEGRQ